MIKLHYQQARYLLGAAESSQFPKDMGVEVAFMGRSNVGKSSALNILTQQKKLARTSKTPGRTQLINFFAIDDKHRLVDLPGYGYAKVSAEIKKRWQENVDYYLRNRKSLKGIILLMDARHPLQLFDDLVLHWTNECRLSLHVVLTKADKLNRHERTQTLKRVKQALLHSAMHATCQLFSAMEDIGHAELRTKLNQWFAI